MVDILSGFEQHADTLNQFHAVTNSQAFFGSRHYLVPRGGIEYFGENPLALNQWMLWVFVAILLMIALARFFFPVRFRLMFRAVSGLRYFLQIDKDGTFFSETPTYLLTASYLAVFSLLVNQTLDFTGQAEALASYSSQVLYAGILAFFSFFYAFKYLALKHLAWVFSTPKATALYLKNIFLLNQFMGICILPLVFYNAFNPGLSGLSAAWVMVVTIAVYKLLRGAILGYRASGFSIYYLILYLCAVELAPLVLIGKAASIYLFNH